MNCPRCGYVRYQEDEGCERCGYGPVIASVPVIAKRTATYASLDTPLPIITQALRAGDLLGQGRYRLIEQIRLSVHGDVVWLARDLLSKDKGQVEIREIRLSANTAISSQQELRSLTSRMIQFGQHAGLPTTLGTFEEEGKWYFVYQHIEGVSLSTYLRRKGGALPERTVAEYGRQLCDILSFFSRQQPRFVHSNISPDTIIVSPDEQRITLVDLPFTVAEMANVKGKGSSGYHAPEQTRGDGQSSPTADLFSVAATMHHAVTGYNPSERITFFYPPARRLNPNVSQRMEEILAKELLLSVSQRYARAVDMQVELAALLSTYPPPGHEHFEVVSPSARRQEPTTAQLRTSSHNRSLITYGVTLIALLALVVAVLVPIILPLFNPAPTHVASKGIVHQQQSALNAELALEQQTFKTKGIGLSDGRFALDVDGRADKVLKQEAAQAIQQGNLGSAVNLLTQTVLTDPTDAEAQIYNEDVHILQSGAPYVTIVLGVAIDQNVVDQFVARADMQGAFIAQDEVNKNSMLPHGLKLRLLIDSCGMDRADVATVAQFVANRIKEGNQDNIIGVVGWPFSSQTINARDIIASAHVPEVSPTASSVQLSGSSPYFFRVNPPDDQQGKTLGTVAVSQLHAKNILVLRDPTDAYSVSLANSFALSVQALGVTTLNNTFTTSKTSVTDYEKIVNAALVQKADLIFIAGYDTDAVRLAHAVGEIGRMNVANPLLVRLHVLGGDALATNLLLGQGGGADAQIAATYPQDMRRLIFSAFGHPDEWTFNAIPKDQQPPFFADWLAKYQSSSDNTLNAPNPGNDAILTTDAVRVLVQATIHVQGTITGQKVRDALMALGNGGVPAYQGVSGRIFFDAQGNPVNKALVVLSIAVDNKGANAITLTQVVGKLQ